MALFNKSKNPAFNDEALKNVLDADQSVSRTPMTVSGAVNKTMMLMGIMLVGAGIGYMNPSQILMWVGILGGAAIFFFASRNPDKAPILAPIYAVVEGLFVGTVSAYYAYMFNGIIFQAASLTMAIMFTMLFLYKSGLVKVTDKFRAGISMAVGGIMIYYLVNIVLHFLGINIPYIHDGGMLSIGICGFIIVIASMNLLLDFDNFHKGEAQRAPQYMEWMYGMGLLFTLIWLYVEILRMLSYLSND